MSGHRTTATLLWAMAMTSLLMTGCMGGGSKKKDDPAPGIPPLIEVPTVHDFGVESYRVDQTAYGLPIEGVRYYRARAVQSPPPPGGDVIGVVPKPHVADEPAAEWLYGYAMEATIAPGFATGEMAFPSSTQYLTTMYDAEFNTVRYGGVFDSALVASNGIILFQDLLLIPDPAVGKTWRTSTSSRSDYGERKFMSLETTYVIMGMNELDPTGSFSGCIRLQVDVQWHLTDSSGRQEVRTSHHIYIKPGSGIVYRYEKSDRSWTSNDADGRVTNRYADSLSITTNMLLGSPWSG